MSGAIRVSIGIFPPSPCPAFVVVVVDGKKRGGPAVHIADGGEKALVKDRELNGDDQKDCWWLVAGLAKWERLKNESIILVHNSIPKVGFGTLAAAASGESRMGWSCALSSDDCQAQKKISWSSQHILVEGARRPPKNSDDGAHIKHASPRLWITDISRGSSLLSHFRQGQAIWRTEQGEIRCKKKEKEKKKGYILYIIPPSPNLIRSHKRGRRKPRKCLL